MSLSYFLGSKGLLVILKDFKSILVIFKCYGVFLVIVLGFLVILIKKCKGTTEFDKRTVTCDVGTIQYMD